MNLNRFMYSDVGSVVEKELGRKGTGWEQKKLRIKRREFSGKKLL